MMGICCLRKYSVVLKRERVTGITGKMRPPRQEIPEMQAEISPDVVECRSAWLEVRFAESSAGRQANVRYGSASVISTTMLSIRAFPESRNR